MQSIEMMVALPALRKLTSIQGWERRELLSEHAALHEPTPASLFVLILPPPPDQGAIAPLVAVNYEAVCLPHSNFTLE